jgi:IclR family mhp operon transcriptional activator
VRHRDVLVEVAQPLMDAFTHEHKWQLNLATRESTTMLMRATTYSKSPFEIGVTAINHKIGILSSVLGRAYFAACSDEERDAILQSIRSSNGPESAITADSARVERMVQAIRRVGYATIRQWPGSPARRIAIPIRASESAEDVLAAMVMFWYPSVMTVGQAARKYLDELNCLAARIATALHAELDSADSF